MAPAPDQYQLWVKGSTIRSLVDPLSGGTASDSIAFLTQAQNVSGWTTGDNLYFSDANGECWTWLGTQQLSNPGIVGGQYGTASTSNICNPPTDNLYYNWLVVDMETPCTPLPTEETFTYATSGSTTNTKRQGSYDFWVAMGSPASGDQVRVQDEAKCYEFRGTSTNIPAGGATYSVSVPAINLPAGADCAACKQRLTTHYDNWHSWSDCSNPTAPANVLIHTVTSSNLSPEGNDDVYVNLGSPNIGDVVELTTNIGGVPDTTCVKYEGISPPPNSNFSVIDNHNNNGYSGVPKTDCSSCLNPSTEDQYFHNWKRHTTCGTNPVTHSITTISCTGTTTDAQRQGSHDFWVAMGEPNVGDFVTYDNQCWEYMGYDPTGEVAPGNNKTCNVTPPTPALTSADAFADCTACYTDLTSGILYHLFSECSSPATTFIGLGNTTGSTSVTTADNNALYTAINSPSQGQYFQFSDGLGGWNCFRYEGQGTSAQTTGSPVAMNHITGPYNVGSFFNDCTACQTPPGDYHRWMKCGTTETTNLVAISGSNTPAENGTFWTNAGSPNVGDIIMLNTVAEQAVDTCYEYLGTSPSAESGVDFKTIDSPASYIDCATCTTPVVPGCTNPSATNYNPAANQDDGSCIFINGCTDPTASNYNPNATTDDGSCIYCVYGCTDSSASNYDPLATCDDGSCIVVQGGTGCTIAFGTEECQPDGTANVNIDLSAGGGLSNIVTTINGTPFGSPTGCTPSSDILVTGLTQGQTIKVVAECSYQKEDYNSSLSAVAPGWANAECGESEQVISNDTKVYCFYDGTSLGEAEAKKAYRAVMEWLIGLSDFTPVTTHGDPNQNVFHTAVAGERWLDWAVVPITGKFSNNQTAQTGTFEYSGNGANSTTITHCNPGTDCYWSRSGNNWIAKPYGKAPQASKMHVISNWAYDTATTTGITNTSLSWTVDPFYDTAQVDPSGTGSGRIGAPMPDGSQSSGNNGTQTFIGAPPAASTDDDVLVICFADESAMVYHGDNGSNPTFGEKTSHSSGSVAWTNISTEQPTVAFKDDYTEYINKRNAFVAANNKSYKAFLYPSKPTGGGGGSHYAFPSHALAAIHSGNNTPQDGKWQAGTVPTNVFGASANMNLVETQNPYWTNTTPTYGGLDQHGWGVNVAEEPFTAAGFVTDLTVFLGSGATQTICDDSQCLFIKAVDENGVPVSGYPITVNGISAGTTDAVGMVSQTLTGPSSVIINDCYTFAAVGTCLQTQVTITVTEAQFTTALNCILGCTDPLSWNYNPLAGIDDGSCMYPLEEDPRDSMSRCELLKIDTECQFATDIYNIYKHDRFGFERACLNNIEGHINKKYSSDWVDRLLPDYGTETMTKKTYTNNSLVGCDIQPCGESDPCDTGMDVAFVIDITSSMNNAIDNVKAGVSNIVSQIVTMAGTADYKLSLTLSDEGKHSETEHLNYTPTYSTVTAYTSLPSAQKSVVTGSNVSTDTGHPMTTGSPVGEYFDHWATNMEQFNTNNQAAFTSQLSLLNTASFPMGSGTHWIPEPVDMAVEMVGLQSFAGTWRNNVAKYIVIMTDAWPGGDNNTFNATDVTRLATLATNLVAQNIKAIVIGQGVQREDPDNPGTYPWRVFAEATGGIWNAAGGGDYSTATINSLRTLCDSSEPSAAYDGSECILVVVKDKDGQLIPDYEIVLDGLYAGKTNEKGELKLNIPNAAEDTEHKINLCHCFTTTGVCGKSQKIEITVDGVDCDDCGNIKMF